MLRINFICWYALVRPLFVVLACPQAAAAQFQRRSVHSDQNNELLLRRLQKFVQIQRCTNNAIHTAQFLDAFAENVVLPLDDMRYFYLSALIRYRGSFKANEWTG